MGAFYLIRFCLNRLSQNRIFPFRLLSAFHLIGFFLFRLRSLWCIIMVFSLIGIFLFRLFFVCIVFRRLGYLIDYVLRICKLTFFISSSFAWNISCFFKLSESWRDTVHSVLTDSRKTLEGIIPFFGQWKHKWLQAFCFQRELSVSQVMVCHYRVIVRFFNFECCRHNRFLLTRNFYWS